MNSMLMSNKAFNDYVATMLRGDGLIQHNDLIANGWNVTKITDLGITYKKGSKEFTNVFCM